MAKVKISEQPECCNQGQAFPVPVLHSPTVPYWATSRPVLHILSQTFCKLVSSAALVSLKHRNVTGAFRERPVSHDTACNNVPEVPLQMLNSSSFFSLYSSRVPPSRCCSPHLLKYAFLASNSMFRFSEFKNNYILIGLYWLTSHHTLFTRVSRIAPSLITVLSMSNNKGQRGG